MTVNETTLHRAITYLVFPVLFFYSAFFGVERLYGDVSFYLSNIIHNGEFFIAHNRPAAVFTEWLPLLLVHLGAPMRYIIYSYSLAECLYFFTCYWVLFKLCKAPNYAIAMVLAYIFGLRWNYFNPVSELVLGMPFAFFIAWFWVKNVDEKKNLIWYIVSLAVCTFLIFCHPLYVVGLPVIFAFINYKDLFTIRTIVFGLILGGMVLASYLSLNEYEHSVINKNDAVVNFYDSLRHIKKYGAIQYFAKAYAGLIFVFAFMVWYLYKNKYYIALVILLAFSIGYGGFGWYKYYPNFPKSMETLERLAFIIPLTILVLFAPYINKLGKLSRWALVGLCVWHLFYLGAYGFFVSKRFNYFNLAYVNAAQFKENKVLYSGLNFYYDPNQYIGHDYNMIPESLLLTSMNSPLETKQVFVHEVYTPEFLTSEKLKADNYFYAVGNGWMKNIYSMPKMYFNLQPSAWRFANTDSVQNSIDSLVRNLEAFVQPINTIKCNKYTTQRVVLYNTTGKPLFSGTKKQTKGLAYRWINKETQAIENYKQITPLFADLFTKVEQLVVVYGPERAGNYFFELGFVYKTADGKEVFTPFKQVETLVEGV